MDLVKRDWKIQCFTRFAIERRHPHSTTVVHRTEDQIIEITTTIDDQTPEQLGYIIHRFLDAGVSLDVYYRSVVMKRIALALN